MRSSRPARAALPRVVAVLISLLLLSGCAGASSGGTLTEYRMQDPNLTAVGPIDEAAADQPPMNLQVGRIGTDATGHKQAVAVRFDLPSGVSASQVRSAAVEVEVTAGKAEKPLVARGERSWSANRSWNELRPSFGAFEETASKRTGDVLSIDVTQFVREWLSGDAENDGVLITAAQGAEELALADWEAPRNSIALVIRYKANPAERAGAIPFAGEGEGNCFAFAVRDRDAIEFADLSRDIPTFQRIYDEGGESAALQYVKGLMEDYADRHAAGLHVIGFRELESYDDPIDASREQVIAMRIGFRDSEAPEGIQLIGDFDYHFWVRLYDGSWAEKLPEQPSRRVPGTNTDTDPGRYPWGGSYQWGLEKWAEFYDSEPIYWAIEKDTAFFTGHKGARGE
jgi:hypothetical protein